jgi:hypothetical protein
VNGAPSLATIDATSGRHSERRTAKNDKVKRPEAKGIVIV